MVTMLCSMQQRQQSKAVIGVTGGIGSGKTLVAGQLAELGCVVIDADALAADALEHRRVRHQLVDWWGPGVIDEHGGIKRRVVARIVFDDPEQLRRLESLIHPHVYRARQQLYRRYQDDSQCRAIVEDCPLLLEVGLDKQCDAVIFVAASREVRLRRLAASRGWAEQDLARREKNQLPLDTKAKRADYVVVNDADEAETRSQVSNIFSQIMTQGSGGTRTR